LESKDGRGHASRKQNRLRQILPQWVAVEGVFNFFTGHSRTKILAGRKAHSPWYVACNHLIKNGNSRSMLPLAFFSFGSKKVHIGQYVEESEGHQPMDGMIHQHTQYAEFCGFQHRSCKDLKYIENISYTNQSFPYKPCKL